MQTVQSRLYTNVVLTAIAVLLAVIAFKPLVSFGTLAFAAPDDDGRNAEQRRRIGDLGEQFDGFAASTEQVAEATRDVAAAIREAAKSQTAIAKSIEKLGGELAGN